MAFKPAQLPALLILLLSGAQAAPQAKKASNVFDYLASRGDTLMFRSLLARWVKNASLHAPCALQHPARHA